MAQEATQTRPVPLFHRLLHRNYKRGTQLSHFFNSRVTPIAWGGFCVLVAAAVLGTDIALSALYQVFTLMLSILGISLLGAWVRRAKLSAERVVPQYATVGEECSYVLKITNEGRSSLASFRLWDRTPDPRPSVRVFSFTPEPGEEKRNIFDRNFIYYRWKWLMERRTLFSGGLSPLLGNLKRGATESVRVPIVPQRRGIILLQDLRVQLPDPLGLFQRCRVVQAPVQSLVVLPKRYRLPPLDLPGQACFQLGGEAGSNTIGTSGEFLGLREYRSGDALRHVHWKAWAKIGKPIVKEFEDVYFPRYGLVLDNFVDPGNELLFEEAVSVAASFAAAMETQSTLLDLMFVQGEAVMVSTGRGVARTEKMLEVLAGVEAEPEEHFEALRELVKQYAEVLTSCLCVFTGWSAERAAFLRALGGMGLETVNLIVCRDRALVEAQLREYPACGRVLLLEEGKIQQDLMAL
jgi:uncharacterized protein (DUF58 family)